MQLLNYIKKSENLTINQEYPEVLVGTKYIYDIGTFYIVTFYLKCATSITAYRTSDGIADTFIVMFPSPTADAFSMRRPKISYLLSDGLGHKYWCMMLTMPNLYTVDSRYLELRYLELCEVRSVYLNQK